MRTLPLIPVLGLNPKSFAILLYSVLVLKSKGCLISDVEPFQCTVPFEAWYLYVVARIKLTMSAR